MRRVIPMLGLTALCIALCVACGDDQAPGDDAGLDARVDARVDAADASTLPEVAPLTVEAVTYNLTRWGLEEPGAGALVEIRQADGVRLQSTADAAGHAIFAAVDFGPGPVSVTGYLEGLPLTSVVAVTAADSPLRLRLKRPTPEHPVVGVSGTAHNMTQTSNVLSVTSTRPAGIHHAVGSSYAVDVEAGEAFTLVGTEWWPGMISPSGRGIQNTIFQWMTAQVPALADATSLDLDFADASSTFTATGSFTIPTRPDSPFQSEGLGFLGVTSRDSNLLVALGIPLYSDVNAANDAFEYQIEWIEAPGVVDPVTLYFLVDDPWSANIWAFYMQDGYPRDGHQDTQFFDRPRVLQPGEGGTQGLHDPVVWQAFDPEASVALQVHRFQEIVWEIYRIDGVGEITVPPVPEGLDRAELLGSDPLDALLILFELGPPGNYLLRGTFTDYFTLNPS